MAIAVENKQSLENFRESSSLIDAINEHGWYLSKRREYDVGFEFARKDFVVNYLIPWMETNPSDVNGEEKPDITKCVHVSDLCGLQSLAYDKAVGDDQFFLGLEKKRDVKWDEAETDFMEHYLFDWALKFKRAYCGHICSDRNRCDVARRYAREG